MGKNILECPPCKYCDGETKAWGGYENVGSKVIRFKCTKCARTMQINIPKSPEELEEINRKIEAKKRADEAYDKHIQEVLERDDLEAELDPESIARIQKIIDGGGDNE